MLKSTTKHENEKEQNAQLSKPKNIRKHEQKSK